MKKMIYIALLIFTISTAKAQETQKLQLNWLNQNAVSLDSDYLSKIKTGTVIGLGEASHGTEEFFREKNKIVQYLIKNQHYTQIGFEFTDTEIEKINHYVLTGKGDLKVLMDDFRLYKTQSFFDLFEWIKNYNNTSKVKVEVFGFSKIDFTDPYTRDSLMAECIIERQVKTKTKTVAWSHNLHLARNSTMAGVNGMGQYLKNYFESDYYNIAFDTYQGTVNTLRFTDDGAFKIESHKLELSVKNFTELFSEVKFSNFYVYLRQDNPLSGTKNSITNIWADWRAPYALPVNLTDDFDAVIFIKNTTASIMLK